MLVRRGRKKRVTTSLPTWVANCASNGVATLQKQFHKPRGDEARSSSHTHRLTRHFDFFFSFLLFLGLSSVELPKTDFDLKFFFFLALSLFFLTSSSVASMFHANSRNSKNMRCPRAFMALSLFFLTSSSVASMFHANSRNSKNMRCPRAFKDICPSTSPV
jgi:hypothetical protein